MLKNWSARDLRCNVRFNESERLGKEEGPKLWLWREIFRVVKDTVPKSFKMIEDAIPVIGC